MTMLKVEDIIFVRGEGGAIIPQVLPLETYETPDGEEKPTIKAVILPKGKLAEITQLAKSKNKDDKTKSDNDIIKYGLIEPKLTDDQITELMPSFKNAIAIAIMAISVGYSQQTLLELAQKKTLQDSIDDEETELKKK